MSDEKKKLVEIRHLKKYFSVNDASSKGLRLKKNTLKAMIKGSEYRYPYFAYFFLRLDLAITIPPKTPHHSTGAETNEILLSLPVAPSPYFSL